MAYARLIDREPGECSGAPLFGLADRLPESLRRDGACWPADPDRSVTVTLDVDPVCGPARTWSVEVRSLTADYLQITARDVTRGRALESALKRANLQRAHLARLLGARRAVDRAIADPSRGPQGLAEATCSALVRAGGFRAACLTLMSPDDEPTLRASVGETSEVEPVTEAMDRRPPCVPMAATCGGPLSVDTASVCRSCARYAPGKCSSPVAAPLAYGTALYGVICTCLPVGVPRLDEDREFLKELSDDLATALHSVHQERASERAEALYQALLGACPNGVVLLGFDGRIRAANDRMAQVLGVGCADDLVGTPIADFTADRDRTMVASEMMRLSTEGGTSSVEIPGLRKDGSQYVASVNACVHRVEGEGASGIATRRRRVGPGSAIEGLTAGDYVLLEVADTGVGMDEQTRARVFEPFFSSRHDRGGTGLGLSTVYGIVKQSGGHIELRSAPGCGTTFEILLPIVGERSLSDRESSPPSLTACMPAGETVLLVDDEAPVRRATERILSAAGHRVLCASSGARLTK